MAGAAPFLQWGRGPSILVHLVLTERKGKHMIDAQSPYFDEVTAILKGITEVLDEHDASAMVSFLSLVSFLHLMLLEDAFNGAPPHVAEAVRFFVEAIERPH